MSHLYVLGGRQKSDAHKKEEWHSFSEAVILRVDPDSRSISEAVQYVSPPEACPDLDPSIVFKAGDVAGQRLYACTQTETLVYDLPSFTVRHYVSHPWYNDLHHVRPSLDGTLLVANTGLDIVQEVGLDGRAIREWNVANQDTWTRFSKTVDYRKVLTTKPHLSHPNHVCYFHGELWVTRAKHQDVYCVTRPEFAPIKLGGDEAVHDGRAHGNQVYFTAVNGRAIVVNAERMAIEQDIDLQAMADRGHLGWCRGLDLLDDGYLVVGVTRLRPTRWGENVIWAKRFLGGSGWGLYPTSLVAFDLKRKKLLWELNVEPHLNSIFSIHFVP